MLRQPAVTRDAEARLEGAREVAHRQTTRAGQVRQPELPVEVRAQQVRRAPALPAGKAAARSHPPLLRRAVALDEVRAENELEPIQGE